MSTDYSSVSDALARGADPAMLCATCPWDRSCITPPALTKGDIDGRIAEASARDEEVAAKAVAEGKAPAFPAGSLMAVIAYAGKDTSAPVCPVFALRLRSSGGRQIADGIRSSMQGWDDQS